LSSYPDRCSLQIERRTIPGEPIGVATREVETILERLGGADREFKAASRRMFARSPYEIDASHELPRRLVESAGRSGVDAPVIGMSFWTDAAVLGDAGIPSVLFGPTGAGLHGLEEWVDVQSVLKCRAALINLARAWC
jgi:acetylornithine deacetylase